MKTIGFFLGIAALVFSYSSCERASKNSSTVSLKLPSSSASQNVGAMACTKCLKAVIVNVSGEGLQTVKYFNKIDFDNAASELTGEVVLEVPGGAKRYFQVLAIYHNMSTGLKEIQYGSVYADLFDPEPPPISIGLANLGVFKGGSLVGRFLTSTDSGPTGRVAISIKHADSGMNMELFEGEILNGWFNFFCSENFPTTFRVVETNQILFQDATLDNLTPVTAVNHIVRVKRPSGLHYRSSDGFTTSEAINEHSDILFGFFGDAALTAGKVACMEYNPSVPAGMTFTNLSTSPAGPGNLTYHHDDSSASVYGVGGTNSNAHASCVNSTTAVRYEPNRISINKKQFDGNGNDTARSMGGAFSYQVVSTVVQKYQNGGPHYLKGLPGLFAPSGTMFDGVKLFKKPGVGNGGGYDMVKCTPQWMIENGFTELVASDYTTVPYVPSADNVALQLASVPNGTDGYIICPTQGGSLMGLGGFFLSTMQ